MKIVMLESLALKSEELAELVKPIENAGHVFYDASGESDKVAAAADADVLVVANTKLDEKVIEGAARLKLISVGFTGLNHIPLELCKKRGIEVRNAAGYATVPVAELTVGMAIACLRNMTLCDKATREGRTKAGLVGFELKGKTVGIVGTGAIGIGAAKLFAAFGCKLLGYSRSERSEAVEAGVKYVSLDELMSQSDIICLHTPLTADTENLINASRIAQMKKNAYLINMARGGVVDNAALAQALKSGSIAGAGIDVYEGEPPIAADHPLMSAPNAILTPHVAFATAESMSVRGKIVFNTVYGFLGIR